MGCGLTDVGLLQMGGSGGGMTPSWPEEGLSINQKFHGLCHDFNDNPNASNTNKRVAVEKFHYRMFAYLLELLRDTPEGGGMGSMLDNSVIMLARPMAVQHSSDSKMMFMLAGGASGQLDTGRFLSFGDNRNHGDLLVNLCNLMGLDDEVFGDPAYCGGALDLS